MNYRVEIPWGVPSKKNRYVIRFNPKFWDLIKPLVERLRKAGAKRLYWVSPDDDVRRFEENASWPIKGELLNFQRKGGDISIFAGEVEVWAVVYVKNFRKDTDNATGALGDALEKGLRGFNDRQIRKWVIEKRVSDRERVEVEILRFGRSRLKILPG